MTTLVWDKVGERVFETGLDRGVLYLSDMAIPWNGLTSVVEKVDAENSPVYFDGMKINNFIVPGDFSATMKAITYPDEFMEYDGTALLRPGVSLSTQVPKTFNLSYRTKIGSDVNTDSLGYKIHILYNATAIPSDKTFASIADTVGLVEFEWEISAIPEEISGFRPTAHFIIDTRHINPDLLSDLEEKLYGNESVDASFPLFSDLISMLNSTYGPVEITDNEDGTWTASSSGDQITSSDGIFQISEADATPLGKDEFKIYS
jgi:hypothetical protein